MKIAIIYYSFTKHTESATVIIKDGIMKLK